VAGASFIRVDLHVHTFRDSETDPSPDLEAYVAAAIGSGIGVLAITDHNTARFAAAAVEAAATTPLLVLPGIEVSTHDGHLLGLFAPEALAALEEFALPRHLQLKDVSATEQRSSRSLVDLIADIHARGGLAIPAHVDAADGLHERLAPAELEELLTSPALAGIEFAGRDALAEWFTDRDPDNHRRAAWMKRQSIAELRGRGLARLMSSDAHSVEKLGQDRSSRTLTRLRLDDPDFGAVRNAIALNPKARCKAEVVLPASYSWIQAAEFHGGFLDGVTLEFSPNLNCIIGGRGSGKSTALLAIRAAVGAHLSPEDDPDAEGRMPDETIVRFIDSAGSERVALRRRGQNPIEPDSGSPVRLRLADLGQDESGRLARGYDDDPRLLLAFMDGFVVRYEFEEREADLAAQLAENASDVERTSGTAQQIERLESEHARLDASLKAAQTGRVELIADWAGLLAAQAPFLVRLEQEIAAASQVDGSRRVPDIDALATDFGVDLARKPATDFVDGDEGLRQRLAELANHRDHVQAEAGASLARFAGPAKETLARWQAEQADLERRLKAKQQELEAQGLKVQAGAIRDIATRLNTVKGSLNTLRERKAAHQVARKERTQLLDQLHANREQLYELRRATLRRISDASNSYAEGLTIAAFFERCGMTTPWTAWLTAAFGFRSPRVNRLAAKIAPAEFAEALMTDPTKLLTLLDDGGEPFFTDVEALKAVRTWDNIFELQVMRLEDRPRLQVQEPGNPTPKQFDELSAGQQRSVLLSLLLCAERDEPLVLDQPEDHLDAQYIASAVVRHLEGAKERRQVLIATHSANLTVLGDAELVAPMEVVDGRGRPHHVGAVDRPETRDCVCALLEGGVEAYRNRGLRYGFRFASVPL
jgi:energy-coupling factor transporter ATP-binding protein EcfA2